MNLTKESIIELVKACAEANPEAIQKFFEIYSQDIYNFPIKVFHMTEDDASDFFLYAFERLKNGRRFQSFQGKSSFRTWFYTVLRNMLIDWKRSKKEIKTVTPHKVSDNGQEYFSIENEPDEKSNLKENAKLFTQRFYDALDNVKTESRVVFKLAYIYYLNFNNEEAEYIMEKADMTPKQFHDKILEIRTLLSEKEVQSIKNEDKITALYTNILDLKESLYKEKPYQFQDNLPQDNKIETAIKKKYEQRRKLILKKDKGHFLSRTPYKVISSILQIPEGSVSIALQRIIEKIKKNLDEM